MNRRGAYEDLSFLLYLVPFAVSGVYALILWSAAGFSSYLPERVYIDVTRDPDVFLLGAFAVMLALFIDLSAAEPERRTERLIQLSKHLQGWAIVSVVLAFVAAWYANGFSADLSGPAADMLTGKYTIVFPALLFLMSFLIVTPFKAASLRQSRTIATLMLIAVPPLLYEAGKRSAVVGLGASFILIVVASLLLAASKEKNV